MKSWGVVGIRGWIDCGFFVGERVCSLGFLGYVLEGLVSFSTSEELSRLGRAQHALLLGDLPGAFAEFKVLVEESPENMEFQARFASLLWEDGQSEAARWTWHMVARHWEREGYYLRAVTIWRKLVEVSPSDLNARRHLGDLYVELQLYELARPVYWQLAETFAVQGNFGRRLAMLESILRFSPGDYELHLLLARELEEQGKPKAAAQHLAQACDGLYAAKDWARLVPNLRRLLERSPVDGDRLGQLEEAESALLRAQARSRESSVRGRPSSESSGLWVTESSDSELIGETTSRRLERGEVPPSVLEAFEGSLGSLFSSVDSSERRQQVEYDARVRVDAADVLEPTGNSILARLSDLEVRGARPARAGEAGGSLPAPGISSALGRRPFGPSSEVLLREPSHLVASAIRARHRGDAVLALTLLEDGSSSAWPSSSRYERALSLMARQQWFQAKEVLEGFFEGSSSSDLSGLDLALIYYQLGVVAEMLGDASLVRSSFRRSLALAPDEGSEELLGRIARVS